MSNNNANGRVKLEEDDVVEVRVVSKITPLYNDKSIAVSWDVEVDNDETFNIESNAVRAIPERLVVVNGEHPTVTATHHYEALTHAQVERYMLSAIGYFAGTKVSKRIFERSMHRMVNIYLLGETVTIPNTDSVLEFGYSISNSYDLSLGVHINGYLYERATRTGFYVGHLASFSDSFLKHFWTPEEIVKKIKEKIDSINEGRDEIVALCGEFATRYVNAEIWTRVGRELGFQKREVASWNTEGITVEWVKGEGFTVTAIADPTTAWDMLKIFARESYALANTRRRLDVNRKMFSVISAVLL
jgi:hypothetical protein